MLRRQDQLLRSSRTDQYGPDGKNDLMMSSKLEEVANEKGTTVQTIALAYLLHKTPYVFPIVGARTTTHVKAFNDPLSVSLSQTDLDNIDSTLPFNPLFPNTFLYEFSGDRNYNIPLTASDNFMTRMGTQIGTPPHQPAFNPGNK